jgi:malate dehydrogenase
MRSDSDGWRIVKGVPVNEFSRAKIDATVNELKEERALVADLLPK